MANLFNYNDPLLPQWRDVLQEITESRTSVNNTLILSEIPDVMSKVQIPNMTEVFPPSTPSDNQFQVDYNTGFVQLGGTVADGTVFENVHFFGRGVILLPVDRVYSHNKNTNLNDNLQEIIDNSQAGIDALSSVNQAISDSQTATKNANDTANNIQTIWQQPVTNFTDIATTYPTPSHGWTVMVSSTGEIYRYEDSTDGWKLTQKYTDVAITDLQNKTLNMRQSELIPSLSPIETDGMTLSTFYIPRNPIILGTITL